MSDRTPIEGERAVSQVALSNGRWLTRNRIVLLGMAGVVGVGALVWSHYESPKTIKTTADETAPHRVPTAIPWTPDNAANVRLAVLKPPPPPPQPPATIEKAVEKPASEKAADNHPSVVSFKVAALPEALRPKAPATPAASGAEPSRTEVAYKTSQLPGIKAGRFGNSAFKLKPGLLFCEMQTAIIADQSGSFLCKLRQTVYSDRQVPLMLQGTQVRGHYSSHNANGQSRIAGLDLVATTPDDCTTSLGGSPVTDTLGAAGMEGEKNTHFFQKFGFALALSLVDIGTQLGQSALSGGGRGNTNLSFNAGGSGLQQFTQEVLREKMQIKDTITVNQGSEIGILIEDPIDFTACKVDP